MIRGLCLSTLALTLLATIAFEKSAAADGPGIRYSNGRNGFHNGYGQGNYGGYGRGYGYNRGYNGYGQQHGTGYRGQYQGYSGYGNGPYGYGSGSGFRYYNNGYRTYYGQTYGPIYYSPFGLGGYGTYNSY